MMLLAANTIEESPEIIAEATEKVGRFANYMDEAIPKFLNFGVEVILAIVFFCIGAKVIKWVRKIVRKSLERSSADLGVEQFVDSFLKFTMYILLIVAIAMKFGLEPASVAAVIGSAGIAIGLAVQGSLSNLAGGILILLLKPFVVGDYIIEHHQNNEGTVKEIQIFYTKLATIDNKIIVIPNGSLANNSLTNVTGKDERRLDLQVEISYKADLKQTKKLIEQLLKQDSQILTNQELAVFVDQLGHSAVVIGIRAWVRTEEYWNTKWRILEEIKETFDREGIEIPYNQLTVHMGEHK